MSSRPDKEVGSGAKTAHLPVNQRELLCGLCVLRVDQLAGGVGVARRVGRAASVLTLTSNCARDAWPTTTQRP